MTGYSKFEDDGSNDVKTSDGNEIIDGNYTLAKTYYDEALSILKTKSTITRNENEIL